MWHAEVVSLVLRRYDTLDGFDNYAPFHAVAFVKMLGHEECFIEGALHVDGGSFTWRDWRDLGNMLRDKFGIKTIRALRKGRIVAFSTKER